MKETKWYQFVKQCHVPKGVWYYRWCCSTTVSSDSSKIKNYFKHFYKCDSTHAQFETVNQHTKKQKQKTKDTKNHTLLFLKKGSVSLYRSLSSLLHQFLYINTFCFDSSLFSFLRFVFIIKQQQIRHPKAKTIILHIILVLPVKCQTTSFTLHLLFF